MSDTTPPTSTKPYLIRALYEWCTDNGLTPYIAVFVNAAVHVPKEYVKNREIVLNISFEATQALKLDNDAISFKARFAGSARDIFVPMDNIVALYARENGQGMAFPLTPALQQEQAQGHPDTAAAPRLAAVDDDAPPSEPRAPAPSSAPRRRPRATAPDAPPAEPPAATPPAPPDEPPPPVPPHGGGRPALKRVK